MKKVFVFILLVLASPVFSQTAIAVLDFNVNSEKSEYRFLGKGFSQFLLVELSQVQELTLVEREKRNEIINEIKFGLSGLADDKSLAQLGSMLQSDYMVAGEIFDMAGTLIVTGRLIDIENSSVVAQIGVEGTLDDYKGMTRQLAIAILNALKIDTGHIFRDIVESESDGKVLSSFSQAVSFYDKGDNERAKAELEKAKNLDKNNKAIIDLENKLIVISPKFQFEDPIWQSPFNPSLSAFLENGTFYLRYDGMGIYDWYRLLVLTYLDYPFSIGNPPNEVWADSFAITNNGHFGFNFPVGERIGINTELALLFPGEEILIFDKYVPVLIDGVEVFQGNKIELNEFYLEVTGGISYKIIEQIAIGLNGSFIMPIGQFNPLGIDDGRIRGSKTVPAEGNIVLQIGEDDYHEDMATIYVLRDKWGFLLNPGFAATLFNENLFIELNIAIPLRIERFYYDYDQDAIVNGSWPVYLTNSINGTIIKNKLFGGLKTNFDIYKDPEASGFFLKETPVLEFWPIKLFAIRVGYIFTYFSIDSRSTLGHGFLGGITLNFDKWAIDFTYNQRKTPLSTSEGSLHSMGSMLFAVTIK